jgi:hypothetical protein
MAMFRLDYLSCLLTVVATVLVGRKMWTGLVVSGLNSFIVCVIGLHTSQYGFIPANVFCICINAFNLRAWLKVQKEPSESTLDKQRTAHKLQTNEQLKKSSHTPPNEPFQNPKRGRSEFDLMSRSKGMWPLAPTLSRINANVGVPHLDALSSGSTAGLTQISTVLPRFRSHQSSVAPPTTRE